jgi:hypothetical protein
VPVFTCPSGLGADCGVVIAAKQAKRLEPVTQRLEILNAAFSGFAEWCKNVFYEEKSASSRARDITDLRRKIDLV